MRRFPFRPGRTRLAGRLGLALLIGLAAGCGPKTVKMSGHVLQSNGQPLPGGRVLFQPADASANSVPAVVNPDGTFEAVLPVGGVSACVDNQELLPPSGPPPINLPGLPAQVAKPAGRAGPSAPPKAPTPSPGTYVPHRAPTTTNWRRQASISQWRSGQAQHDITLKVTTPRGPRAGRCVAPRRNG